VAFTTVTVTRDYDLADGTDPIGTVSFTPTAPMVNGPTVVAAKVTHRLDVDGVLSIELAANTDPATLPVGTAYLVQEDIAGATRSYYIEVPHNAGSSIDLSTLASVGVAPTLSFPAVVGSGHYLLSTATGVDPTGVTECAAVVNTFITAHAGRSILVDGTFKCSTAVSVPSGTELVGAWPGAGFTFTWTATGSGSYYLGNADQTNGNTGIRLRDLTLTGAGDGTPAGATGGAVGILLRRGSDLEIRGCRVTRTAGVGIAYQGVQRIKVIGNTVYQGGRDGITGWWYTDPLTDVVVSGNTVHTVGDDGIAIVASTVANLNTSARPRRISITNNTVYGQAAYDADGAGRGIVVIGVEDVAIAGNSVSDTFSSGISVYNDTLSGSSNFRSRNVTISGNNVRRGGQVGDSTQPRKGIRVAASDYVTVTGNSVFESYEDGIYLTDVTYSAISGNVITENGTLCDASNADCGINLDGGSSTRNVISCTVTGNILRRNAANGVRVYYADRCIVANNEVVDNGNAGNGSVSNGAGIQLAGDTIFFVRGNHCFETRSSTARTQTYGITIPALGGTPTLDLTDNYAVNHPGPNINLATTAPLAVRKVGNREGTTTVTDNQFRKLTTSTTNYTVLLSDGVVLMNGTSLTATLPTAAAAGTGTLFEVKNINASSATVAVTSSGTIDGSTTVTLTQNQRSRFVSNGTTWYAL
jgi:parallel beta-helix repeat protein